MTLKEVEAKYDTGMNGVQIRRGSKLAITGASQGAQRRSSGTPNWRIVPRKTAEMTSAPPAAARHSSASPT